MDVSARTYREKRNLYARDWVHSVNCNAVSFYDYVIISNFAILIHCHAANASADNGALIRIHLQPRDVFTCATHFPYFLSMVAPQRSAPLM